VSPPAAVGSMRGGRHQLRAYGWFFIAAPPVAIGGLLLPRDFDVNVGGVAVLAVICLGLGGTALRGGLDRFTRAPAVLTALFIAAVSGGQYCVGRAPGGYELFYLWALGPGVLTFSRRGVAAQFAGAAAGYGVVLLALYRAGRTGPLADLLAPWFVLVVTLGGVLLLVWGIAGDGRESAELSDTRGARQAALVTFSQQALAARDPETLHDQAAALIAGILDLPFAGVLVLEGEELRYAACVGFDRELTLATVVPQTDTSLAGTTLRRGAPVVIEDLRAHPEIVTSKVLAAHSVVSSLSVAIRRPGGEAVGVLFAQDDRRRAFSGDDEVFIQTVAHSLALAQERQRADAELGWRATHDPLTGLISRAGLAGAFAGLQPPGDVVLLLMDLDSFKDVNDSLGHQVGDELLTEIGRRLSGAVRRTDVVARLGGDEFAVAVPGIHTAEAATKVARQLLTALERPVQAGGVDIQVGASIGMSLSGNGVFDLVSMLRQADVALYEAKTRGSVWAVYSSDADADVRARVALSVDLRAAIERDEIRLAYQPLVRLDDGHVAGIEALARWNHPDRGAIPPDVFIPVAEQTGLIRPLTRNLVRQAIAQVARWRAEGLDLTVSVNLSVKALHDPELLPAVERALLAEGLPAGALVMELTESAFAHPASGGPLADLRDLGVRLSIDDFGTGYSSLSYLKRLPVSEVKIDRSFIGNIVADERDRRIVAAVVDLAHGLGLRVVVEGVETADMSEVVAELGCDIGQGYWYSRPQAPADLTGWLLEHNQERLCPLCGLDEPEAREHSGM
jgi:diguanylate cyclase (GGDEF)-like protein